MNPLRTRPWRAVSATSAPPLVRFIVPVTVAAGMYLLLGGSLSILDFAGFLVLATKLVEAELMLVASISALRGMAPSGRRLDAVMTTPEPTGEAEIRHGDAYAFENVSFRYGEGSGCHPKRLL